MTRSIVKTASGFTVYGAFTCVMHLDHDKNVVYCNMVKGSPEYDAMLNIAINAN